MKFLECCEPVHPLIVLLEIKPDEILEFRHIPCHHLQPLGRIGLDGKAALVVDGHPTGGKFLMSEGPQDIFSLLDGELQGILFILKLHI